MPIRRYRVADGIIGHGNYADEVALTRLDGQPNQAPRELSRGVFDFGAGVDVHVWRFVALLGEARDFYTGSPNYNVPSISGRQHNIVALARSFCRGTNDRGPDSS